MDLGIAQQKLKVAAIYTVPVEQQWVSRIHKALNDAKGRGEIDYVFSEKVANADYERVMREYAEKGNTLIVGESFASRLTAFDIAADRVASVTEVPAQGVVLERLQHDAAVAVHDRLGQPGRARRVHQHHAEAGRNGQGLSLLRAPGPGRRRRPTRRRRLPPQ